MGLARSLVYMQRSRVSARAYKKRERFCMNGWRYGADGNGAGSPLSEGPIFLRVFLTRGFTSEDRVGG